jgi:SAM-dependent methyltransferase
MPSPKKHIKKILHLGCGMHKKAGSIGVDFNPKSKADIIHDLNKFPYPFKNNQFDLIIAEHIIEHLDNIPKVMEEIHRIARDGAKVLITTSHFTSVDSFTDPTHRHFFTSRTFDYFISGTELYKFHYSKAKFKKKSVVVGPINLSNPFLKLLLAVINKFLPFYEKRLAFILPVGVITYELEAKKSTK